MCVSDDEVFVRGCSQYATKGLLIMKLYVLALSDIHLKLSMRLLLP